MCRLFLIYLYAYDFLIILEYDEFYGLKHVGVLNYKFRYSNNVYVVITRTKILFFFKNPIDFKLTYFSLLKKKKKTYFRLS